MINADLHSHTCFSHGQNTPLEMHLSATKKGIHLLGFSEHSPRPQGYNYKNEYRERLNNHLNDYVNQVLAIKRNAATNPDSCQVLFGMEIDWLNGEETFINHAVKQFDFDYLIGSVHYLDHWGFDDSKKDWDMLSQEECEKLYVRYFEIWQTMLKSRMFQIAAHPDLIKIFSIDQFRIWLQKPQTINLIKSSLLALRDAGMAMEISSAGLRKQCNEIYPHPILCKIAAELDISISFASDAHNNDDIAFGFSELAEYAHSFGFTKQVFFDHGQMTSLTF